MKLKYKPTDIRHVKNLYFLYRECLASRPISRLRKRQTKRSQSKNSTKLPKRWDAWLTVFTECRFLIFYRPVLNVISVPNFDFVLINFSKFVTKYFHWWSCLYKSFFPPLSLYLYASYFCSADLCRPAWGLHAYRYICMQKNLYL